MDMNEKPHTHTSTVECSDEYCPFHTTERYMHTHSGGHTKHVHAPDGVEVVELNKDVTAADHETAPVPAPAPAPVPAPAPYRGTPGIFREDG